MAAVLIQLSVSGGGMPKLAVPEARVTRDGVADDWQLNRKYHGGCDRAVCIFSDELYDWLRRRSSHRPGSRQCRRELYNAGSGSCEAKKRRSFKSGRLPDSDHQGARAVPKSEPVASRVAEDHPGQKWLVGARFKTGHGAGRRFDRTCHTRSKVVVHHTRTRRGR